MLCTFAMCIELPCRPLSLAWHKIILYRCVHIILYWKYFAAISAKTCLEYCVVEIFYCNITLNIPWIFLPVLYYNIPPLHFMSLCFLPLQIYLYMSHIISAVVTICLYNTGIITLSPQYITPLLSHCVFTQSNGFGLSIGVKIKSIHLFVCYHLSHLPKWWLIWHHPPPSPHSPPSPHPPFIPS